MVRVAAQEFVSWAQNPVADPSIARELATSDTTLTLSATEWEIAPLVPDTVTR